MSRLMKVAVMTVAFAAMAVSSASATSGPAMLTHRTPIGVASNTAAISGNTAEFPGPVLSIPSGGGSAIVECRDGNFDITTASITTNSLRATPTYNVCQATVAGLALPAAVDHNCEWTFTFANSVFNDSTGAGTNATVDTCETTITIPSVGCTLHVTALTNKAAGTTQNITSTGGNDTSTSPWGSKIIGSATGLHYSTTLAGAGSTCGVPATGNNAQFTGTAAVRNLWGML